MSIEFNPTFDAGARGSLADAPRRSLAVSPQAKRAVSAKRLAANRANARKSTGARTPAGKQRVAGNALKHRLAARYGARLPSEEAAASNTFIEEIRKDLLPHTTMQP